MKKKIAALALILCVASASTVLAKGKHHGKHGGYHNGHHNRSYYRGSHGGGHHNDGLEFAVGVAGGLLLGSVLMYSATTPPPQTVVYSTPHTTYQPPVVVQQPTICVEDRVVNGQWQINPGDGSKVWVPFAYPVTQRFQVPCN